MAPIEVLTVVPRHPPVPDGVCTQHYGVSHHDQQGFGTSHCNVEPLSRATNKGTIDDLDVLVLLCGTLLYPCITYTFISFILCFVLNVHRILPKIVFNTFTAVVLT